MAVTAVTENHEFEVNNNPKLLYWTKKWATMKNILLHYLGISSAGQRSNASKRWSVERHKSVKSMLKVYLNLHL